VQKVTTLRLSSSAFNEGEKIPKKYTADGPDVSPPLKIEGAGPNAESFALIMDDPDAPAGTWVHWLIWNILAKSTKIPEGIPADREVKALSGAKQGVNDFGRIGYGGPSPPPGSAHRYRFKLYALDATLDLRAGASLEELEKAVKGHTIAESVLTGIYGR
jgi:hypothetical protein